MLCPGGGTGIHAGLKILWSQDLVGSSPTPGTILKSAGSEQTVLLALGQESRSDVRVCPKGKASTARRGRPKFSLRKFMGDRVPPRAPVKK